MRNLCSSLCEQTRFRERALLFFLGGNALYCFSEWVVAFFKYNINIMILIFQWRIFCLQVCFDIIFEMLFFLYVSGECSYGTCGLNGNAIFLFLILFNLFFSFSTSKRIIFLFVFLLVGLWIGRCFCPSVFICLSVCLGHSFCPYVCLSVFLPFLCPS
jgi:hypothetical protein